MPKTIVKCSASDCEHEAVSKVAAPWRDGGHAELKTFGYTCAEHLKSVTDYARMRPQSGHLAPEESVGEIAPYPLGVR